MDTLNVVLIPNIPEEHVRQIQVTDSRVKIKNAGPLFRVKRQVEQRGGQATPEEAKTLKELNDVLREADVLYTLGGQLPKDIAQSCPKIKWVQLLSAGAESAREARDLREDVLVTNATGCNAIPVAEHAMGFMLMFAKQSRRSLANQSAKKWERFFPEELAGKTVGVIGLGNIGSEVARLSKAFRMKVLATRRSATKRETNVGNVDEMYPLPQLKEMLSQCDFVVVSVPLTPESTKMIGEPALHSMKPAAYFINVSRGPVVDQPVLIRALKEGWIAGAAVDVTDPEPLQADSDLWDAPNLMISPHVAGATFGMGYRTMLLFCDNIKRYLAGEKLVNLIDRKRGY